MGWGGVPQAGLTCLGNRAELRLWDSEEQRTRGGLEEGRWALLSPARLQTGAQAHNGGRAAAEALQATADPVSPD